MDNAIFYPLSSILDLLLRRLICGEIQLVRDGAAWRWPDRERGRGFAPSLMVGLPPRSVG
jgi:hypothetical protein